MDFIICINDFWRSQTMTETKEFSEISPKQLRNEVLDKVRWLLSDEFRVDFEALKKEGEGK